MHDTVDADVRRVAAPMVDSARIFRPRQKLTAFSTALE
jgi:hypothetical protein